MLYNYKERYSRPNLKSSRAPSTSSARHRYCHLVFHCEFAALYVSARAFSAGTAFLLSFAVSFFERHGLWLGMVELLYSMLINIFFRTF